MGFWVEYSETNLTNKIWKDQTVSKYLAASHFLKKDQKDL